MLRKVIQMLVLSCFAYAAVSANPESKAFSGEPQSESDTDAGGDVVVERLTFDAAEIYSKLEDVINSDPRHVYPLLLGISNDDKAGLVLTDRSTQAYIPTSLTEEQAHQIVGFAYDETGRYRGLDEFLKRLNRYLERTRLHQEEVRVVDIRIGAKRDSPTMIRITTTDHERMCEIEPDILIQQTGTHQHITELNLDRIELQVVDVDEIAGLHGL